MMNSFSNRDRLLAMVQNKEPNRSPRPLVYDLTKYGGVNILLTNYYKTEEELRILAKEEREEHELREREFREKYPNLFTDEN